MTERSERGGIRQRMVDDYAGHKLYDERGEKIGKVEYTVLDTEGRPEYLAVKTGWFGSDTTLIPESVVRPGERDEEFTVQASEDRIKDAPTFGNEDDVSPDFEDRVREYFGLSQSGSAEASTGGAESESRDRGDRDDRDRDDRNRGDRDDRSREDDRAFAESGRDSEARDSDRQDSESRDREDIGRERDERSRDDLDRDTGSRDTGSRDAAVAGGAAGAAASGATRDSDRGASDRGGREDERGASGSRSGETVRVTVKRERARAERVRGEDGKEEVRIRKETVEEEQMIEVEDRL